MRRVLAAALLLVACHDGARGSEAPGGGDVWRTVDDRDALLAALGRAAERSVLLDVSASWCLPCGELRTRTLADPRIVAAVADYATIELDISRDTVEQRELTAQLGVDALPCVLRFDRAPELRDAIAFGRPVPTPSMEVRVFVTPSQMLAALSVER